MTPIQATILRALIPSLFIYALTWYLTPQFPSGPLSGFAERRIAIIGAGAGGSSSAYYLQKYTNNSYDITIFEKSGYVGGRSTTIGNLSPDDSVETGSNEQSIELGASIFVSSNKILMNAVKDFELETHSFSASSRYLDVLSGTFGVWDGKEFIFESSSKSWWSTFKIIKTYGLSPLKTFKIGKNLVNTFLEYYYDEDFPFENLEIPNYNSGFNDIVNSIGLNFLTGSGISEKYSYEIVQAATRANYIQNIDQLNGLDTMISLATDKSFQVVGGNWQIFENFINSSNSDLRLNTEVTKLTQGLDGCWTVTYKTPSKYLQQVEVFDEVIIASPLTLSQIEIESESKELIEVYKPEFAKLHVTIFSTKQKINGGEFFNIDGDLPELILTTTGQNDTEPPFYSINIVDYNNLTGSFIYKIFSPMEIELEFIYKLYNIGTDLDGLDLKILDHILWRPFPLLTPKEKFEKFEICEGLWYLNTMESLISTMETSCLAGANVAALISKDRNSTVLVVP